MGKFIFAPFQNFFPIYWIAKLVTCFFLFCLTKQLCYATYGLEHSYISIVKQIISTS